MSAELQRTSPQEMPPLPARISMAPRWIFWALASVVLPVLPWLTPLVDDKHMTPFVVMTVFAIVCQIAASTAVGIGIGRKRAFTAAGTFGMSVLFTVISLVIASVVYFVSFMIFVMMLYEKAGP